MDARQREDNKNKAKQKKADKKQTDKNAWVRASMHWCASIMDARPREDNRKKNTKKQTKEEQRNRQETDKCPRLTHARQIDVENI